MKERNHLFNFSAPWKFKRTLIGISIIIIIIIIIIITVERPITDSFIFLVEQH